MEMADAADATPVSLCAIGEDNIPAAEKVLPKNLCPLIKAGFGGAVTDRCPFLSVTTDYSTTDQGQIDTRLGTFIELLG